MKFNYDTCIDATKSKLLKEHIYDVIGCCQDVHKELGPWLNEYIYQEALKIHLRRSMCLLKRNTTFK